MLNNIKHTLSLSLHRMNAHDALIIRGVASLYTGLSCHKVGTIHTYLASGEGGFRGHMLEGGMTTVC